MSDDERPQSLPRTPERDEVLRRVGRNVVTFQQIEQVLKYLTANSALIGPASQLLARRDKAADAVRTKTMGDLAGRLLNGVLQVDAEQELPEEIDEAWLGFRFSIDTDAEFVGRHDQEMRAVVDARNDLVHHFLPRWQSAVNGDTEAVLAYLDAQHAEALRMFERLRTWGCSMVAGRKQLAEFIASPEGQRVFDLAFLRDGRLVLMLGEIAVRTARADGWALLSTAANLIKREAPAEFEAQRKRSAHRNLKGVLLAAGVFDVADEQTPGGGVRTIYRINESYELHFRRDPAAVETTDSGAGSSGPKRFNSG